MFHRPVKEGSCDVCGGVLMRRPDDNELAVHAAQGLPREVCSSPLTGISRNAHLHVKTSAGPPGDPSIRRPDEDGLLHRDLRIGGAKHMNGGLVYGQQAQERLRGEGR